jgi:hypothetical protein
MIKWMLSAALPLIDMALVLFVLLAGLVLAAFRRMNAARLHWSKAYLLSLLDRIPGTSLLLPSQDMNCYPKRSGLPHCQ